MSNFNIKCPRCKCILQADESWIGATLPCPKCKHEIMVQKKGNPAVPAAASDGNWLADCGWREFLVFILMMIALMFFVRLIWGLEERRKQAEKEAVDRMKKEAIESLR